MQKIQIAAALAAALAVSGAAFAGPMYVVDNQNETLYAVDVATVSSAVVGAAGIDVAFGGLGFAANGTLYGFTTNSLYTVNTGTGAWFLVGASGTFAGDSFDINPLTNRGYVSSFAGLNEVNLATGAAVVAAGSAPFFAASAFGEDGTFYISTDGSTISKLDIATGVATLIGATGSDLFRNLAYNPDDDFLYAVGTRTGNLWRINPATGAGTSLGAIAGLTTNGDAQYTMSTFQFGTNNKVPEPTTLALLALGLVGMCLKSGRRRL